MEGVGGSHRRKGIKASERRLTQEGAPHVCKKRGQEYSITPAGQVLQPSICPYVPSWFVGEGGMVTLIDEKYPTKKAEGR